MDSGQVLSPDMLDLTAYLAATEPQQNVRQAGLYIEDWVRSLKSPQPDLSAKMPWSKTHPVFAFRPGEVTLWGGANGSGKSLITGQVALSLLGQKKKVCIASFEMKPRKTVERMARQFTGLNPLEIQRDAPHEMSAFYAVMDDFRTYCKDSLWLYDQQGTVSPDTLLAVIRYCKDRLGVEHFFVDSLMKCVRGEDDYNGQKEFVDQLTSIARDLDMHIHLVHHIRKTDQSQIPTKYDMKGSGAITDQVDNVVVVWRNKPKENKRAEMRGMLPSDWGAKPDAALRVDKQRNGEDEPLIRLWFDKRAMQYVGMEGQPPISYMDLEWCG